MIIVIQLSITYMVCRVGCGGGVCEHTNITGYYWNEMSAFCKLQ